MVPTMTTDLGAGVGARNRTFGVNWSHEMSLMNEALARAHCLEQQSARLRREHEFAQQLVVARAQRSARWAERVAAFAARRAKSRRERANLLATRLS